LNKGADLEPSAQVAGQIPSASGVGRVYIWEGGGLLIGRGSGATDVHSHHAIQVSVGSDPGIPLRFRTSEQWVEYPGVIIDTRQPHAFATDGADVAHIFVEPVTREGRALEEQQFGETAPNPAIVPLPRARIAGAISHLFGTWHETRDANRVVGAAQALIGELAHGTQPRKPLDERLLRAIAFLRQNLHRPVSLKEAAAAAFLSPSRFRHLFVEETGMTLRPYILWLRFMRAWEAVSAGESLTSAAHHAGFADSAHLTRTSRRMFGIAPTALHFEK
jgi:AraC family transcriptional regulator